MMNRWILTLSLIMLLGVMPTQAQNARQDLLTRINNLRSELGLSPYRLNTALNAAAVSHAQWMVATSQVSHIQDNGSSPATRANANGYNSQWVSENIYMGGLASVDTAWTFWINSSIHYAGLTSSNYQDIGIGTAQGQGGRAYVLVFGVPPNASGASAANRAASGNNSAAAAPPIAIVGYDEVGNIQYELQAGETLGDVLLRFGYTWDDLNTLLDLNQFTDADITQLDIGQIVLVPPPQGTYTPTPIIEETEASEPTQIAATSTPNSGIIPTPFPETTVPESSPELLPTLLPETTTEPVILGEQLVQPATFVANAPLASETQTPLPTLQINSPSLTTTEVTAVAESASPQASPSPIPTANEDAQPKSSNPPLWLGIIIGIQIAILLGATIELIRRLRKRS